MHAIAKQINIKEETIFWSMVSMVFLLALMYGYFVNSTIFNVANRSRIESQITQLNSKLGELEFEYLSIKSGITIEKAHELGFVDATKTHFVSLDKGTSGLSFNDR